MAQDFNNIPAGLNIPTQIPLNVKENIINEATLAYLGVSNNLAYTYHDQLIVNCLTEGTRYVWREVKVGEENTGLVPLDFTYPPNIIVYGVIYSNRKFNFFKLPSLKKTYSVANIGTGESVYKDSTVVPDNTQFNLKKISSNTLAVTTSVDGNTINIEQPDSGIPMFIVNSSYIGIEELGTQTKPFKDIQQALIAYVGSGTNVNPENDGVQIQVQKGIGYNFTGNFVYKNLNVKFDGSTVNLNPALSNYSLDYDSIGDISSSIKISLVNGARLNCNKKFIRTKGNTTASPSIYKTIEVYGDGTGVIYNTPDTIVITPSTKALFEVNSTNTVGYNGDAVLNIHDLIISSPNAPVYIKGGNQGMSLNNCSIEYGTTNISNINIETSPFNQTGGTITEKGNILTIYQITGANINKIYRLSNASSILLQEDLNIQGGVFEYIFSNETGVLYSKLDVLNLRVSNSVNTSFADSSVVWDNILLRNSTLNICTIDYAKVKLTSSAINLINGKVVETIPQYNNRAAAVVAGLFSGCKFINTGGVVSPTTSWFIDIVI